MAKLILNSKGLNTRIGSLQIGKELDVLTNNCTQEKSIFIVSFPEYYVDELIRDHCKNVLGILPENIFFYSFTKEKACDIINVYVYVKSARNKHKNLFLHKRRTSWQI